MKAKFTWGILLNRRTWSERVEPGNTSPPIAIPKEFQEHTQILQPCLNIKSVD